MSGNHTEKGGFWKRIRKLMDEIADVFSGNYHYSDYEIYGDNYERF